MDKPLIELITCSSGEWEVLRMNLGKDYNFEGHSIPNFVWVELLETLGYKVECKEISDEDMEQKNY